MSYWFDGYLLNQIVQIHHLTYLTEYYVLVVSNKIRTVLFLFLSSITSIILCDMISIDNLVHPSLDRRINSPSLCTTFCLSFFLSLWSNMRSISHITYVLPHGERKKKILANWCIVQVCFPIPTKPIFTCNWRLLSVNLETRAKLNTRAHL